MERKAADACGISGFKRGICIFVLPVVAGVCRTLDLLSGISETKEEADDTKTAGYFVQTV